MRRNGQWVGVTLIALGVILLVLKVGFQFSIWSFWPIFLFIPAIIFHVFAFTHRISGLLVPGGILLTYAVLFFFSEITSYSFMEYLWPLFIIGPGVGLLELYLFGERKSGVLLAALILILLGGTFISFTLLSTSLPYLIGIALILIGVFVLFGRSKKESRF